MNRCAHCGFTGRSLLRPAWLVMLALLVWLLPLGFLLPSIAITAWAVTTVRRVCPRCGQPWQPAARHDS
jgi:ribosomal protein L37E